MAKKLLQDLYSTHFSLGFNENPTATTNKSHYVPHRSRLENFRNFSHEKLKLGNEKSHLRTLSQDVYIIKGPLGASPRRIVPGQRNSDSVKLGSLSNEYQSSSSFVGFSGEKVPELIKIDSNLSSFKLGTYKKRILSTMQAIHKEMKSPDSNHYYETVKNYMRENHIKMGTRYDSFKGKDKNWPMISARSVIKNNYTPSKVVFGRENSSKMLRSSSQDAFRKFDTKVYREKLIEFNN